MQPGTGDALQPSSGRVVPDVESAYDRDGDVRRPVEGLVAVQLDGVELRGGDDVEEIAVAVPRRG